MPPYALAATATAPRYPVAAGVDAESHAEQKDRRHVASVRIGARFVIARTVIIFVQAAGTAIYYRLIPGLVQCVIRTLVVDPVRNLSWPGGFTGQHRQDQIPCEQRAERCGVASMFLRTDSETLRNWRFSAGNIVLNVTRDL